MGASLASGICCVLILIAPLSAVAESQATGEQKQLVFSVEDAVKRTLTVDNRIRESRSGVDASRSKKLQADAARWAQIEANLFTGPSSESDLISSTGTIVSKSTSANPVVNGAFGRAVITVVQPLYTFGKISSFREAAARGVKVSEAAVDQTASEVALQVQEFYFGALLASDIREFLKGLREDIVKSMERAEKRVEAGSPAATLSDVYQLRSFVGRIDKGIADAEEGRKLAMEALRTALQLDEGVKFELKDKRLTPAKSDHKSLENYLRAAVELRPEFVQVREGIKAREALVEAATADLYPVFFAALLGDFAGATNRDQSNVPIITDPLQHAHGGVVVGLNWQFDFGIKQGRIDEAQAQKMELIHKKAFANQFIPLQVRKAFLEFETANENIGNTKTAYRNARRWLVTAVANIDLGIGDTTALTQAFILYIDFRVENFRAIHAQRVALANLAFATGEALQKFSWHR
jgi:outer membrane protein TolC